MNLPIAGLWRGLLDMRGLGEAILPAALLMESFSGLGDGSGRATNLALVGAGLEKSNAAPAPSSEEVDAYLQRHIEELAEEEHIGWMEERVASGWRRGSPRDNARKLHPLLVDYAELAEEQKAKDRDAIRNIPDIAEKAGYAVVWLKG